MFQQQQQQVALEQEQLAMRGNQQLTDQFWQEMDAQEQVQEEHEMLQAVHAQDTAGVELQGHDVPQQQQQQDMDMDDQARFHELGCDVIFNASPAA
jgi:hypothetical protein